MTTDTGPARPTLSVIMPVRNAAADVRNAVAMLSRQTFEDFEILAVDDGSTDGTGERLEALAAEHDHVTTVRIPNSGWPGRPRNVGLDTARGEFVYFVDHDDWIGDEALERAGEADRAAAAGYPFGASRQVGSERAARSPAGGSTGVHG